MALDSSSNNRHPVHALNTILNLVEGGHIEGAFRFLAHDRTITDKMKTIVRNILSKDCIADKPQALKNVIRMETPKDPFKTAGITRAILSFLSARDLALTSRVCQNFRNQRKEILMQPVKTLTHLTCDLYNQIDSDRIFPSITDTLRQCSFQQVDFHIGRSQLHSVVSHPSESRAILPIKAVLAARGSNLASLKLSACEITDKELEPIGLLCPNLIELDISYNYGFTNAGMSQFAKRMRNLEVLRAVQLMRDTQQGLCELIDNNPKLVQLAISIQKPEDLTVLSHVKGLTHLELSERGIMPPSEAFEAMLTRCPGLTHFKLESEVYNDEHLSIVARRCPKLTHLQLGYSSAITVKGIQRVLEDCRQMTSLDLNIMSLINPDELTACLAKYGKNLTTLHLSSNYWLSDAVVAGIQKTCPWLKITR